MGLRGRWVHYGSASAQALREEIAAAKGGEPLAPVTVIVASNQIGVSVRRQLASGRLGPVCGAGPGLIAVSFLTPYRLAELLGASSLAATGRRPVSTPVVTAAVRTSLAAEPGAFAGVATHPSTEAALVAAYRELREVSGAGLDALAATSPRAAEVVRLHRATRARLEAEWYDEQDLMGAAAETGAGATDPVGTIIVHLPQRLSGQAATLLRTLARTTPVVALAGTTGNDRADADVALSVHRLGLDLPPAPADDLLRHIVGVDRTHLITTSDADDEVRAAVRRVLDAVRGGTPLDRIALLHASADPYGRLLHEHLAAAGISANGTADLPLSARMVGRTLLGLLDLPASGLRRPDVFAWLTGAPILHEGRWVPTSAWERLSRTAGVVGGRRDWDELLANLAQRHDADAEARDHDPDAATWQAERSRADAASARSLRTFVLGLADDLDGAATRLQPWSSWAAWAHRLLADLLGSPARREAWPLEERRAGERTEAALDRLGALDAVEGDVSLDVFTRTLQVELDADLGRVGRFGEGVLVAPVSVGVGLDLDLVVVVGMAEGTFPATVRDDSLLPDEERRATGGELPLRGNTVERLHHQFVAALAGADRHLLCIPRGDLRRSSERVPSRWALDVASHLAEERWWSAELLGSDVAWVTHVASFDDGLRRTRPPATAQEHRLLALAAAASPRRDLHAAALAVDPLLGAGVEALDARHSTALTRFDGNLRGLAVPSPTERRISATRLEQWSDCPHGYFQRDLLRVEPVEQPEDQLRITPLDRGNLVHRVLEEFVLGVLARPEPDRPEPADPWTDGDHAELERLALAAFDDYERHGLTGRPIFWRRDRRRLLHELHEFLDHDQRHRAATGSRPAAAELPFGLRGSDPVQFPLPDGRRVPIRGKADRVDLGDDGTIHVVDYKTGNPGHFPKLSAEDPHHGGTHLQLPIYAEAARLGLGRPEAPVRADFWFVSTRGKFQRIGYQVTDDVLTQVSEAMATIVEGIEHGLFLPHPKPPTTSPFPGCPYCDPDNLGTGELRRQWIRKLGQPEVAPYLALVGLTDDDDAEADAGTEVGASR